MGNELIMKFRDKGINIEKTKSRHEIFSAVIQDDPGLLDFQSTLFPKSYIPFEAEEQKLQEL